MDAEEAVLIISGLTIMVTAAERCYGKDGEQEKCMMVVLERLRCLKDGKLQRL